MKILHTLIAATLAVASLPISASANEVKLSLAGQSLRFSNGTPFIQDGSSFFPLRDLLIGLGVTNDNEHIIWDGEEQTVTAVTRDLKLVLKVGEKSVFKNGVLFRQLEVPVQNVDGHVYLPARAVAEAFGYQVGFDSESSTVNISLASTEPLPPPHSNEIPGESNATFDEIFNQVYDQILNHTDATDEKAASLLTSNNSKLLDKLVSTYRRDLPSSTDNKKVKTFVNLYIADASVLAQYSIDKLTDKQLTYNVNTLIAQYPSSNAVPALKLILLNHPISDARYNSAYLLSENGTDDAFKVLSEALVEENDLSVFGNIAAASIKLAKTDSEKIKADFSFYAKMNAQQKSMFTSMMNSIFSEHADYKDAWKKTLNEGTDSAGIELLNAIRS